MKPLITAALAILLSLGVALEASVLWYEAYQEALSAVGRRDWSAAEEKLQQSIQWGPKGRGKIRAKGNEYISFFPEYYLGVIYFRQENYSRALNQFGMVESSGLIIKGTPEYFEMNDLIRQAQGNIQQFKGNDDVAKLLESTKSLIDQQRYSEARVPLEEARSKDPSNSQIPYLFTVIYKRENEKQNREEVNALILNAKSYIKQERWDAARIDLQEAALKDPSNTEIQRMLEEVKRKDSPPPVVEPEPEPPVPEPVPAEPAIVVTEPSRETKAIRAFYQGQYQDAITQLLAMQKDSTDPAKVYFYLGCSYAGFALKTGNNKEALIRKARENFLQAWKLDPAFKYHNRFISPQIAHLYLMEQKKD